MIHEIIEMFSDWPIGTLCASLITIGILCMVGSAGYGVFWCFNYIGMPEHDSYGVIETKKYTPATYSLKISVGNKSDFFLTNEYFWNNTNKGDELKVTYQRGRITNSINIISVTKP